MTFGVNAPNGLIPTNIGGAGAWTGQANWYPITTTASNSMFTGDPVTLSTAGTVIRATASQAVLGVLGQVSYQISSSPEKFTWAFWPGGAGGPGVVAGTTPMAYVYDDPMQAFTIQEASNTGASGTPLTQAAVGNNANILYTAGSTVTGISAVSLDNTTSATTLVGNLKIVSVDQRVTLGVPGTSGTSGGVQTAGAFANWIVMFNNHVYKAGSTRP